MKFDPEVKRAIAATRRALKRLRAAADAMTSAGADWEDVDEFIRGDAEEVSRRVVEMIETFEADLNETYPPRGHKPRKAGNGAKEYDYVPVHLRDGGYR